MFQDLHDLLEEETTMEENSKSIEEALISTCQEELDRKKPATLNSPDIEAAHTDLPTDVTPSTIEEIKMAIEQIKSEKAVGPDNIPAEALESDMEVIATMLHVPFRRIWEEEKVSSTDWKEGHFINMTKNRDLSKDITLFVIPGKVFNRVLLNAMKDSVDSQLRD
ncbi:unnamed protein product [Schistosoma curassoni]|uniref:Band_3_cyto domain-containing protein n=1 Tax=Schistosoma curassoni TaxID=6186 RepID=A0A183KHV8_9TREM|nr:unnamed protein product [Schistosoma curassoni]